MWLEEIGTIQTWVNGGEVILKKVGKDYAFRLVNEAGDWLDGLPDGMVWADAQALFGDSLYPGALTPFLRPDLIPK